MDDKNGLPYGRGLLGHANLERQMAIWTVVWDIFGFGGSFLSPPAPWGFSFRKTAVCWIGMCDLAGVARQKWPSGRPRFAWPYKSRTVYCDLDRVFCTPAAFEVRFIAPGAVGICFRNKKNGCVLYRHV